MHQPKTRIIGMQQVEDEDGNKSWKMPDPMEMARHFINARKKAKHLRGELSLEQATHEVPIYRGLANNVYKQVLSDRRYHFKLASQEWLEGRKKLQDAA